MGQTPALPGIELAAEDYRRLARLAKTDAAPTVEVTSTVRYYDTDHNAYNVLAEIPGRDPKAGGDRVPSPEEIANCSALDCMIIPKRPTK